MNFRKAIFVCSSLLPYFLYAQKFQVSYTSDHFKGPFSGKVLLYVSKETKEPREIDFLLRLNPFFATEVKNIKPGDKITIDDNSNSYPVKLSEIERGKYYVQAVWDRNTGGRQIGESPDNLYSKSELIELTSDTKKTYSLVCTEIVPTPVFNDTKLVKEIKLQSRLLSDHQKRPVYIAGAVMLPKNYFEDSTKKYPLFIQVSGFGGDYHRLSGNSNVSGKEVDSISYVTLFLDGNCPLGHSVYTNSENNGPWGDALVKELIPELEKKYRCNGFRLVYGHSSGGWTVLWLQTHYPEFFNACWSSSPDPVDFRNFQKINLYEDNNIYYDKQGNPNPVATIAGAIPIDYMKDYFQMEAVVYRGGQMRSFDAVFSKKGANGEPERLIDAATGNINKEVFEHWKQYDISLYLRTNWSTLEPKLKNKILVTVGEQDNFLLNHAVHLLETEMKKLNAAVQFAYFPGDHFTVASKDYYSTGQAFISSRYKEWLQTMK
ncbi:MAG: hypothetical protein C5B52_00955 [Bacteroidetes bacterium]|nr:MAG: hypothetical protein C5B52_00955 [Bacteroidota bacterium]